MKRKPIKIIPILLLLLSLPARLYALPQDQEVFLDFEDAEGSGNFTLGDPPNEIQFLGFTIETLEDPTLLHSGTKALTLGPGQEGLIVSNRGINTLEFYAAESTGGSKIELRGLVNPESFGFALDTTVITVIPDNGVVEGLPANISPGANPLCKALSLTAAIFLMPLTWNYLKG